MIPYGYLSLMSIIDIFMESSVKIFNISNNIKYIIIACLLYAIQPLFFYKLLQYNNSIGISNISWNITSSLIIILFGIYKFNESYSKKQIIGIILGVISLGLLY